MSAEEIFRNEARELLIEIEECILEIEADPSDKDTINKLFRAMHTIKGSGAMFGYDTIADFTHHVETLMDKVRNDEIPITKEIIDVVLKSADHITYLLQCHDENTDPDKDLGIAIVVTLSTLNPSTATNTSIQAPDAPISSDPTLHPLTMFRISFKPAAHMLLNGSDPSNMIEEIREMGDCSVFIHQNNVPELTKLNPEECSLWWELLITTTQTADDLRDVFIFVEDDCELTITELDPEENAEKRIGQILIERGDIDSEKLDTLLHTQKPIGELLVENNLIEESNLQSALLEQKKIKEFSDAKKSSDNSATIRVPADKLDSLVDLVGELVTVQARLAQKSVSTHDQDLILISEEIERLTSGLRDETMSIRMLQIGSTFNIYKRLVRDLSETLNKNISLVTEGGDTELDKTVIEQLKDPLVHIIRNSIDHGIESKDQRATTGKPESGTIRLSAQHVGAQVHITVQDDGKGLDAVRLKAKAIEKGLISADADISDHEIYQLIFSPGFSTAEKVTDLSGRGVGMDVVRQNIEKLRGSIDIDSTFGVGTTITLKLPLTLAIIDGLMVTIEDDFYIIPLSSVEECLEIKAETINEIEGRNIINVRGEAIPYVHLRDTFKIDIQSPDVEQMVITTINEKRVGLVVDRVIGGHQTVIKSLGKALQHTDYISGATILGDGTVALIIAVNKIIDL
ncbi:MAG: chemotaxis protein CheA [Fibrobacterales bacterium]